MGHARNGVPLLLGLIRFLCSAIRHVESVRPVHLIYSRPCLRGGDGEGQGADLKQVHPSGFPYSLINKQASVFEQVLARVRPWNQSSKIGALRIIEYDEHWRDILSMAIRPFDLALHGVVKHQHINEIDDNFDIPVMMFCRLNNHTVQAIVQSFLRKQYPAYYIHISGPHNPSRVHELFKNFPDEFLQKFLRSCLTLPSDFIALDDDLFELGLRNCYSKLHLCEKQSDDDGMVEQISEGILNVLITCNLKPVIFAQKSMWAKRVAERLKSKINKQLGMNRLSFEPTNDGKTPAADRMPRPILVIADRIVDFPIMLHHHCEYRPLIHDCLGIHLNTVAIPKKQEASSSNQTNVTSSRHFFWPLSKEDSFWCHNVNETFPNVVKNLQDRLTYDQDAETDPDSPLQAEVKQAFRGRILDAHTKIITILAEEIERRGLDDFFEVEAKILSRPHAPNIDAIEDLLSCHKIQEGEEERVKISCTANDRMRLFLIVYMCCSLEDELLQELFKYVRAGGSDTSVFSHLLHLKQMDANLDFGRPKGMVAGILKAGTERLSLAGSANVQSSLARIVRQLVIQLQDGLQERMERAGDRGASARQQNIGTAADVEISRNFISFDPFHDMGICDELQDVTHAMVFVNGGGNFVEMMDVRKALDQVGVSCCYGTTDIVSPNQFLHQLAVCGKSR